MSETTTPEQLAEIYFDAWLTESFETLEKSVHHDVTFAGPLATLQGRDDVIGGLKGLASATTGISVRKRLSSETDVITWFTLDVKGAPGNEVTNWCEVVDGKIAHVHVTFDPRPLLG